MSTNVLVLIDTPRLHNVVPLLPQRLTNFVRNLPHHPGRKAAAVRKA